MGVIILLSIFIIAVVMTVKEIKEGMTAPEVAQTIKDNFDALNTEKETVVNVGKVKESVDNANKNTGVSNYPAFSATENVAVGVVRNYNGLLYRSIVAGANEWNEANWERVSLESLQNEKLTELASEVRNNTNLVGGEILSGLGSFEMDFPSSSQSGYVYYRIPMLKKGRIYKFMITLSEATTSPFYWNVYANHTELVLSASNIPSGETTTEVTTSAISDDYDYFEIQIYCGAVVPKWSLKIEDANSDINNIKSNIDNIDTNVATLNQKIDTEIADVSSEVLSGLGSFEMDFPSSSQSGYVYYRIPMLKKGKSYKFTINLSEATTYAFYWSIYANRTERIMAAPNIPSGELLGVATTTTIADDYDYFEIQIYCGAVVPKWRLKIEDTISDSKVERLVGGYVLDSNNFENGSWGAGRLQPDTSVGLRYKFPIIIEGVRRVKLHFDETLIAQCNFYTKEGTVIEQNWYKKEALSNIYIPSGAYYMTLSFRQDGVAPESVIGAYIDDITNIVNPPYSDNRAFQIKLGGEFYSHKFVNDSDISTIPHQSLYDVRAAYRLGFKGLELNTHITKDGKYICCHGENGCIGKYLKMRDGSLTPDVEFSSLTFEELTSQYVYNSKYPQYCTQMVSYEDTLRECKLLGMTPLIQFRNREMVDIADAILGKGNYFNYIGFGNEVGFREFNDGLIKVLISNKKTLEEIITEVEKIGNPTGVELPFTYDDTLYTEEEMAEIIGAMHKRGMCAMVAGCYQTWEQTIHNLLLGGERENMINGVPNFIDGNICNIFSEDGFEEFTLTQGAYIGDDGFVHLPKWGNISIGVDDNRIKKCFLGKEQIDVRFSGKLSVYFPSERVGEVTSDGKHMYTINAHVMDDKPTFILENPTDEEVIVYDLIFRASKC